ncbi:GntR family transcriptional regulator [Caballeronia sp. KNU42]
MSEVKRSNESGGSLAEAAYDRLEGMIVATRLAPGSRLTLQRLEEISGFGRTPVHDAVKRLAVNQLIIVSPRVGLTIAPVDLARERTLLELRTEMEVFACKLATERASLQDQKMFLRFIRDLKDAGENLSIDSFNIVDRLLNEAIVKASGELFLQNTLAPLQTLYRRIGWLHVTYVAGSSSLKRAVDTHIALLETILHGDSKKTTDFVRAMFAELQSVIDAVRRGVDPGLLDVKVAELRVSTGLSKAN